MTKQERDTPADYGYDMAHEDMAHEVTGDRSRPQEGAPQTAPVDDAGDHGYDEAHDFRR